MKKKSKIILCSVVGVLVLAIAVCGIVFFTKNTTSSVSGTIMEIDPLTGNITYVASNGAIASTDEYGWRRTETDIPFGTDDENLIFYSNYKDDDGVYDDIHYITFKATSTGTGGHGVIRKVKVTYYQEFSWGDDLQVFFVFDNGYTSPIINSNCDWGADGFSLTASQQNALGIDLSTARIIEVWVKTVD